MKTIVLMIAMAINCAAIAQHQFVYHFDQSFNSTSKSKAIFTGYGFQHADGVRLELINNLTKQVIMISNYTDSSLSVSHGKHQSFFASGKPDREGVYINGIEDGTWITWDTAGRVVDTTVFANGNKLTRSTIKYGHDGSKTVYEFIDTVQNKMIKYWYDFDGRVASEVHFIGNRGFYRNHANNFSDSVFTREEIEASYPGGENGFTSYVILQLRQHFDQLTEANQSGTSRIRFTIDTDGSVQNIEVTTMKGSMLAKVGADIIKKSRNWNPAVYYGIKVKSYKEQPISFTIEQ
jgi:hypothetical protein